MAVSPEAEVTWDWKRPSTDILHDMTSGLGAFGSLIYNKTPNDQLRLVASVRGDHYQVPNTPDQQEAGISDVENERDNFVNFSWVHSWKDGVLLTISPFYHYNRAHYIGGPEDTPVSPESDRGSTYAGGVVNLSAVRGRHNARVGYEGYAAHDNQFFGVTDPAAGQTLSQRQIQLGQVQAVYAEDQFKAFSWLTFTGGARLTYFFGRNLRSCGHPACRRCGAHPETRLGTARLVGSLLSAAAVADCHRAAARVRRTARVWFPADARRARRAARLRHHHSVPRLDI